MPTLAQTNPAAKVNIVFCDAANQKDGICIKALTQFDNSARKLQRIYVNWTIPKSQTVKRWTRRWSFTADKATQPQTCLFSTSSPLSPKASKDRTIYKAVFSAAEGNGPKVFYTPYLIYGDYTLELFADGTLVSRATFEVRAHFGGDVPIKASLC